MSTETPATPPAAMFYASVATVARILSGVMVGVLLLFLLPLAVPYLENAQSFGYIRSALAAEKAVTQVVKETIPTKVKGTDLTRWIVVFGAFILSGSFGRTAGKFHGKAQYVAFKRNVEDWKAQMHLSDNAIVLTPLHTKLEQLKNAKAKDRDQLLREFVDAKKKLDAMGRDLAFLAIDIVDSTGMKQGEERGSVEHDFKEYKRFVERALVSHGCIKSTWTPDGVMAAFPSVDAAVSSARGVINGLDEFNRTVKSMRRDFVVRCGVNSGFVYFDESMPLEEVSDRVIDIAGHMQKHAKPNTVCVAKPAIEPLNERNGFEPAGRVVDGYEVYEWKKH
jgi:class 3 adenylate cyclase